MENKLDTDPWDVDTDPWDEGDYYEEDDLDCCDCCAPTSTELAEDFEFTLKKLLAERICLWPRRGTGNVEV